MLVFGSMSLVETSDGTFYYLLAMGSVEEVFSKIHHRKRRIALVFGGVTRLWNLD